MMELSAVFDFMHRVAINKEDIMPISLNVSISKSWLHDVLQIAEQYNF
jgi:hypothetical protein